MGSLTECYSVTTKALCNHLCRLKKSSSLDQTRSPRPDVKNTNRLATRLFLCDKHYSIKALTTDNNHLVVEMCKAVLFLCFLGIGHYVRDQKYDRTFCPRPKKPIGNFLFW